MPAEEVESSLPEIIAQVRRTILRRRWAIVLTAALVSFATLFVVSRIPNRYTSEATLLVVQQQVPQRYVVPNSTTDIASELQAMKQEILSRPHLSTVIREFGLYPKASTRMPPELIIELMVADIDIEPIQGPPPQKDLAGFKISFVGENPTVAQQVTSRLTSLFIQENLKTREDQDNNTTTFLREQLEAARAKLSAQEQRVRDFKMQYLGELPDQQQGNLAILTSLQTQLQTTMASLSRAQEQKVYLESLLSGYQALSARTAAALPGAIGITPTVTVADPVTAAETELARLKLEREKLVSVYGRQWPEVLKVQGQIEAAQTLLAGLKAKPPAPKPDAPIGEKTQTASTQNEPGSEQPAVAQIRSQLEANRVETVNLTKEETRLKASLEQYQNRLNLTPVREQQLMSILRDYDLQKTEYADLVNKEQQSQLATNLGKDQRGQQFRLVDPPSLPVLPSSPKRVRLNLGGMAAGLVLGLLFAFVKDLAGRSFHTEKEISDRFGVPLVVGIPLLLTPGEGRAKIWKHGFEWLAGCVVAFAVLAAEFIAYRTP